MAMKITLELDAAQAHLVARALDDAMCEAEDDYETEVALNGVKSPEAERAREAMQALRDTMHTVERARRARADAPTGAEVRDAWREHLAKHREANAECAACGAEVGVDGVEGKCAECHWGEYVPHYESERH